VLVFKAIADVLFPIKAKTATPDFIIEQPLLYLDNNNIITRRKTVPESF
jgi:hypothetical protein